MDAQSKRYNDQSTEDENMTAEERERRRRQEAGEVDAPADDAEVTE